MEEAHTFLRMIPISRVMTKVEKLIYLDARDTLKHALQLLANYKINSCPILDSNTNRWIGFVDALDITAFIISVYIEEKTMELMNVRDSKAIQERFDTPVRDIIDASTDDPFIAINEGDSLANLICGPFRQGVHRAIVVNNGNVVGLVSQMDVLQFIYSSYKPLVPLLHKRIDEVIHAEDKNPVIQIHAKHSLIQGLHLLLKNDVTGIAVVNTEGKIIGNLSANDLKGLTIENFHILEKSLDDLLQDNFYKMPPTFAMGDLMLFEVMEMMVKRKIHRVYITDANFVPKYVCTSSTILRIIARSFPAI